MANQMIALQARAPQIPDLGVTSARMANVIANTAVAREKQNAVQRANEFRRLAQSGVDITTPEGFNQLSGLDPEGAAALRKSALETRAADAKYKLDYLGSVREEIGRARNPQDAIAIGDMLKQTFPDFSGNIDQTLQSMPSDPAQFNQWRSSVDMSALKSAERVKYDYDEVTTELATGANGQPLVVTRGGRNAPTIVAPKSFVPGPQTPTAPRTGEVEVGAPTFVDGGVGGPVSADDAERFILSFPKEAQAAIRQRINEGALGNIPMGSPVAAPNLVAGERGGVGGPYEGYVEAPTPFRLKDPMQAPMPGSAIVPIKRVREEAAAQRVTPTETYSTKRAEKQAQSDVEFLDAYESSKSDAQNILSVINQMIGDLNVKDGKIIQGKRPPHPGFESVIGAGIPGLRFVPGTQSADFDAFMEQVQGGAFLKAYNALRGTGQITEKEGEKATTALSRMKRSQSEAGFVKAAREFEGVVRSAVQRADARAARLRGGTPTAKRNIDDLLKKYGD